MRTHSAFNALFNIFDVFSTRSTLKNIPMVSTLLISVVCSSQSMAAEPIIIPPPLSEILPAEFYQDCSRHISVDGHGNGITIDNPGNMSDINDFIRDSGPGANICIHSGAYFTSVNLHAGGTTATPVIIRGLETTGSLPIFSGTFEAGPGVRSNGETAFEIHTDNLLISDMEFSHVATCFNLPVDTRNITLQHFRAINTETCIDFERKGKHNLKNISIRDAMILQFTRSAILVSGNANNVLIEDVYINMQPNQIGGRGLDYSVGISLYDQASDVRIKNTTVLNVSGRINPYTQGDGIDTESGVDKVLIVDSYLANHQDGCIDSKASNVRIRNTISVGCKRNYRFWVGDKTPPFCDNCISYQPFGDAHFWSSSNQLNANNIRVYSDNQALAYNTDDNKGNFSTKSIGGSLPSKKNLHSNLTIGYNALKYGSEFTIPAAPNPSSFSLP